jgi:hypothetical protein
MFLTSDIKEPASTQNVPNLLVLVQVLFEEGLDLGIVHLTESFSSYENLVSLPNKDTS